MIRTFLFDLGNVLLFFSHERMYGQIASLCGRTPDEVRRVLVDEALGDAFECGRLTAAEMQRELEHRLNAPFDAAGLHQAVGDIFESNADMLPILDALKRRGHRLVLLSNTNATHIDWVRRSFDVLDRFDAHVLSYEVGAMKPQDAIYTAALRAIECDPGECFYTDDIPQYVDRGHAFGLQAAVFTGASELKRELAARGVTL
jgi:glucose-1-phosphatase